MPPSLAISSRCCWPLVLVGVVLLSGCAAQSPKLRPPIEPTPTDAPLPGAHRELPSNLNGRETPRDAGVAFPAPRVARDAVPPNEDVPDRRGDQDSRMGASGSDWRTRDPDSGAGRVRATEDRTGAADARTGRTGEVDRETRARTEHAEERSAPPPPVEDRTVRSVFPRPTPLPQIRLAPGESYFSVQLLVVSTAEAAAEWQAEATRRLGESARIDVEGGLYKIRFGVTREEDAAEEIRRRAVVQGFEDAFLLRLEAPRR